MIDRNITGTLDLGNSGDDGRRDDGRRPSRSRRINRLILTATVGFSIVALVILIAVALVPAAPGRGHAALVYGATLVACSIASYLYHRFEASPRRRLLRYCDHAAIFLLIAGTYTPFAADGIGGPLGVALLTWVWGLALTGVALKLVLAATYDRLFVGLYLAIGWLFLTAINQFAAALTPVPLTFLLIGGGAYTVGAIIFAKGIGDWTDSVWHGCVLTGKLTHFIAVLAVLLAAAPR
jgi:hemolysin III